MACLARVLPCSPRMSSRVRSAIRALRSMTSSSSTSCLARRYRTSRSTPSPISAGGIAEIGDGVERDVRYRLAKHDVEDEEVIDRRARIADRTREDIRGLHGKTRAKQAIVERDVADRDGARNGMLDHLADVEVFEKVAAAGLRHLSTRSFFGRTD